MSIARTDTFVPHLRLALWKFTIHRHIYPLSDNISAGKYATRGRAASYIWTNAIERPKSLWIFM